MDRRIEIEEKMGLEGSDLPKCEDEQQAIERNERQRDRNEKDIGGRRSRRASSQGPRSGERRPIAADEEDRVGGYWIDCQNDA